MIYVICFLFVYIVRSRIGKAVEERKLEKKKGKKFNREEREKMILKKSKKGRYFGSC